MTVQVESIVEKEKSNKFTAELKDIDGKAYNCSVFPMLLVLNITNKTDHIVTLDRTIVRLEDDKQQEYETIQTVQYSKNLLLKKVEKLYDEYAQELAKQYCPQSYLDYIDTKYEKEFDGLIADIDKKVEAENQYDAGDVACCILGGLLGVKNPEKTKVTRADYKSVYQPLEPRRFVSECWSAAKDVKDKVATIKRDALRNIQENIPTEYKDVITSGVYPRIDILPGRTKTVVAPFSKRNPDEIINKINVGIFDLPTIVDAAGNPTKRANFQFIMVRDSK